MTRPCYQFHIIETFNSICGGSQIHIILKIILDVVYWLGGKYGYTYNQF